MSSSFIRISYFSRMDAAHRLKRTWENRAKGDATTSSRSSIVMELNLKLLMSRQMSVQRLDLNLQPGPTVLSLMA